MWFLRKEEEGAGVERGPYRGTFRKLPSMILARGTAA
jgi:hypothetical protein